MVYTQKEKKRERCRHGEWVNKMSFMFPVPAAKQQRASSPFIPPCHLNPTWHIWASSQRPTTLPPRKGNSAPMANTTSNAQWGHCLWPSSTKLTDTFFCHFTTDTPALKRIIPNTHREILSQTLLFSHTQHTRIYIYIINIFFKNCDGKKMGWDKTIAHLINHFHNNVCFRLQRKNSEYWLPVCKLHKKKSTSKQKHGILCLCKSTAGRQSGFLLSSLKFEQRRHSAQPWRGMYSGEITLNDGDVT